MAIFGQKPSKIGHLACWNGLELAGTGWNWLATFFFVKNFDFDFFQKLKKKLFRATKNPPFTLPTHLMTSLSPHLEKF